MEGLSLSPQALSAKLRQELEFLKHVFEVRMLLWFRAFGLESMRLFQTLGLALPKNTSSAFSASWLSVALNAGMPSLSIRPTLGPLQSIICLHGGYLERRVRLENI